MEDLALWTQRLVQGGVVPIVVVSAALWNLDKVLSPAGAKLLYSYIQSTTQSPEDSAIDREISKLLANWFSRDNGFWRFARNVVVLTLASMAVLLAIYVSRTTGMADTLFTQGFIRQFIGNGMVVALLVNWFTFSMYGRVLADISSSSFGRSARTVLIDAAVKLLLFVVLTALTYAIFAVFGSFGGNVAHAILAVPRTILGAAKFENLTAVYFYSVAISSFPIFVVALIRMMAAHPGFARAARALLFWLPFEQKPLRAVAVIFALFIGCFSVTAALLLSPVSSLSR